MGIFSTFFNSRRLNSEPSVHSCVDMCRCNSAAGMVGNAGEEVVDEIFSKGNGAGEEDRAEREGQGYTFCKLNLKFQFDNY